jgi:hypothetical protein
MNKKLLLGLALAAGVGYYYYTQNNSNNDNNGNGTTPPPPPPPVEPPIDEADGKGFIEEPDGDPYEEVNTGSGYADPWADPREDTDFVDWDDRTLY